MEFVVAPSHNFKLEYSVLSQRAYYKENQDNFIIRTQIQCNPNVHFLWVFDGHGQFSAQCSNFVKRLIEVLSNDPTLFDDPIKAYNSAFPVTNSELHHSEIDDSRSGITLLSIGNTLFVSNVGDSMVVIAVKEGN